MYCFRIFRRINMQNTLNLYNENEGNSFLGSLKDKYNKGGIITQTTF